MKPAIKENLQFVWLIACMAISLLAGMVYIHYYQPGDGASLNTKIHALLSAFGVMGGTAIMLFCIGGIALAISGSSSGKGTS